MATEHPFQALFETFGRLPSVHAEAVNRRAYEKLWQVLAVGTDHAGRCILLKAPRAGHGKTHLLSRIQHNLGNDHEFIPLHAASGSFIDAGSVTADTLSRLCRPLPAGGGLCVLDLLVRRLFALALQPLVRSGEVPCQDREGALAALRNRPVETFDFHHPNAVTAHWARENFEVLGPRLALELAQRTGAPLREVMFWVETMFRFAATPVEHPSRSGSLIQSVTSAIISPSQVFERLGALLCLLTQLVRVVLVADDLEGFSADESAALRFGSFLGSLRHAAERVDAILSINRDIWESAFLPRLSGGLADRLSEVVIELEPLNREEMVALLESRAAGLGDRVFSRLDLSNGERHARGIIRAASEVWLKASKPVHPLEEPHLSEAPAANLAPPPPPAFQPAPEAPAAPLVEPVWTPPAVEPQVVSSPFLEAASPPPEIEVEPVMIPPPVTPEPVVSRDFLPSVEPVVESAPVGMPSIFEPPPQTSVIQEEVIPVGRIISDVELETNVFHAAPAAEPVVEAAIESAPAVPVGLEPFVFNPPVEVQSPFQAEPAAWNPPPVEPPSWPTFASESPFQAPTPSPEALFVENVPAASVQAPAFNESAGMVQPPAEPAAEVATTAAEPKETDRVDELLRQFRERYARG